MLAIGLRPTPPASDARQQLRDDLLSCHTKIRRFSRAAVLLAQADPRRDAEIRETARALVGYFGTGLPHHVADEDLSLRPRLEALPSDSVLLRALERMSGEHPPLERLVEDALFSWGRLVAVPQAISELRPALEHLSRSLRDGFETHLQGEEQDVFPSLTRLPDDAVAAIRGEMRARRLAPGG